MTAEINSELDQLKREIAERQRYLEGQQLLIEVLEHDGHDVREQEIALNSERSKLDRQLQLYASVRRNVDCPSRSGSG
ncbi:hypothetical protein [Bradyrhizobium sp. S3.2.12]|uniref:hypothetical protein n=1 Tax=Bradyrhizobium sp. S3.2.12 TaxID=3156387 RepID=UPI0033958A99